TGWQEVTQYHERIPLDVLIIHDSALNLVNREWVQNAYANGVVIAGFNINGQTMSDFVGNHCITNNGFMSDVEGYNSYIAVSFKVSGDNAEDKRRVVENYSKGCGETTAEDITSYTDL